MKKDDHKGDGNFHSLDDDDYDDNDLSDDNEINCNIFVLVSSRI